MTVATGEIGERDAERAGLVPTHAYAVLNVIRVQVCPGSYLTCAARVG